MQDAKKPVLEGKPHRMITVSNQEETTMTQPDQQTENLPITVTGRHVMVTDAMKEYAKEKLAKIQRYKTRLIDIHVTMDIQKLQHIVNIELKVNDFQIKSTAVSDDMYASIDKAADRIQTQVRRYKDRLNERHAKGLHSVDMEVNVIRRPEEIEVLDVNDQIEEESRRLIEEELRPHEVVSKEKRPLKTLTTDEAVMKMELSGDIFLVYRAEEDQKIKVIYRRKDGNYGLIQPEG